jgi:hypothetical protein
VNPFAAIPFIHTFVFLLEYIMKFMYSLTSPYVFINILQRLAVGVSETQKMFSNRIGALEDLMSMNGIIYIRLDDHIIPPYTWNPKRRETTHPGVLYISWSAKSATLQRNRVSIHSSQIQIIARSRFFFCVRHRLYFHVYRTCAYSHIHANFKQYMLMFRVESFRLSWCCQLV